LLKFATKKKNKKVLFYCSQVVHSTDHEEENCFASNNTHATELHPKPTTTTQADLLCHHYCDARNTAAERSSNYCIDPG
jgi:hypothetical protein